MIEDHGAEDDEDGGGFGGAETGMTTGGGSRPPDEIDFHSADYAEFMRINCDPGLLKYVLAEGGAKVPRHRPDIAIRVSLAKQNYKAYEKRMGLKRVTKFQKIVDSLKFDIFWAGMIILNAFTIGIASS